MKQMYSNEPGFRNAVLGLHQRNNTTIMYMRAKNYCITYLAQYLQPINESNETR